MLSLVIWWIDLEFEYVLNKLSNEVKNDIEDPKGIQGNLNHFSIEDRNKISKALSDAYSKAQEARKLLEAKQKK